MDVFYVHRPGDHFFSTVIHTFPIGEMPESFSSEFLNDQAIEGTFLPAKGSSDSLCAPYIGRAMVGQTDLLSVNGHSCRDEPKIFSRIFCDRPGCPNLFEFNVHVPQKRYCCQRCYNAVRLARKRLLHWHRLTGCPFAKGIYRLLGETRAGPR